MNDRVKWRNVGYAEFSRTGKSIRIWISKKFNFEYCYVGLDSLRKLLDGKKRVASIYIIEEAKHKKKGS